MDDAALHQFLDVLLRARAVCLRDGSGPESVQTLLRQSLLFVRDIMTEAVFARALRAGEDGEGVLLFANRVAQLEPLLKDNWPKDFSFDELSRELFGIANGDTARILKAPGTKGQLANAHALLEYKLQAHAIYKVLGDLGVNTVERQSLLIESFGVTLDAFNRWRQEARRKLGADYVERYLVTAVKKGLFDADFLGKDDPVAWATAQVWETARDYRREVNKFRV